MKTVYCVRASTKRRYKLATILLICLLGAGTIGNAQEEPAPQQATGSEVTQQPTDTAAAPNEAGTAKAANLLTLTFAYSLLALTIVFGLACIISIWSSREWPEIESHWGGLGGGLGGVRISPSLLFLVAAIAFAGLLAGVLDDAVKVLDRENETRTQTMASAANDEDGEEGEEEPSGEQKQEPAAENQAATAEQTSAGTGTD